MQRQVGRTAEHDQSVHNQVHFRGWMIMSEAMIHVEPAHVATRQDQAGRVWVAVQARVTGHPAPRRRNGTMFIEVPLEFADDLAIGDQADDAMDPFVCAVIFSAMEAGCDARIHGRVSTQLLANLDTYQRIVSTWWPKYRPVNISADCEVASSNTRQGRDAQEAVMGFSGGMDSIHSLYCHHHHLRGRNTRRIPICLFVHGFDIALKDASYDGAFRRVEAITDSLGSRLVPVRSNIRQLLPSWPNSHPAALAAVLSLFARRFGEGLIASSFHYRNLVGPRFGYGSTPLSDGLLSSHDFRIVHDYADQLRVEKTRVLLASPVALERIRVCWAGEDLSGNCGRCGKCLAQMLSMTAVGIRDFRAFARPLSAANVKTMKVTSAAHWEELHACLETAMAAGMGDHDEFLALQHVLDEVRETFAPPRVPEREKAPRTVRLWRRTNRRLTRLTRAFRRAA